MLQFIEHYKIKYHINKLYKTQIDFNDIDNIKNYYKTYEIKKSDFDIIIKLTITNNIKITIFLIKDLNLSYKLHSVIYKMNNQKYAFKSFVPYKTLKKYMKVGKK